MDRTEDEKPEEGQDWESHVNVPGQHTVGRQGTINEQSDSTRCRSIVGTQTLAEYGIVTTNKYAQGLPKTVKIFPLVQAVSGHLVYVFTPEKQRKVSRLILGINSPMAVV